jgi:hypothetical protein
MPDSRSTAASSTAAAAAAAPPGPGGWTPAATATAARAAGAGIQPACCCLDSCCGSCCEVHTGVLWEGSWVCCQHNHCIGSPVHDLSTGLVHAGQCWPLCSIKLNLLQVHEQTRRRDSTATASRRCASCSSAHLKCPSHTALWHPVCHLATQTACVCVQDRSCRPCCETHLLTSMTNATCFGWSPYSCSCRAMTASAGALSPLPIGINDT